MVIICIFVFGNFLSYEFVIKLSEFSLSRDFTMTSVPARICYDYFIQFPVKVAKHSECS